MGCVFSRTKAEPPIYYLPNKPLEEDETLFQQRKEQVSSMQHFSGDRGSLIEKYQQMGQTF